MGISFLMMPPLLALLAGLGVASGHIDAFDDHLVVFGHGHQNLALLVPLSLPDRTITVSFFLIFILVHPH